MDRQRDEEEMVSKQVGGEVEDGEHLKIYISQKIISVIDCVAPQISNTLQM